MFSVFKATFFLTLSWAFTLMERSNAKAHTKKACNRILFIVFDGLRENGKKSSRRKISERMGNRFPVSIINL